MQDFPVRRWSMRRVALSGLALLAVYLLAQVAGLAVAFALARQRGRAGDFGEWLDALSGDGLALAIVTIVSAVVCVPAVVWLTARVEQQPLRFLGCKVPPPRAFVLPGAALLALVVAYETAIAMLGRPDVHPFVRDSIASAGSVCLLVLALVVAAPIAEETVFRGFVFSVLSEHLPAAARALVAAFAWSVVHVQYDAFDQSYIFALGLLLAWARIHSGSLLVPIGLHAAVNLLTIAQGVRAT